MAKQEATAEQAQNKWDITATTSLKAKDGTVDKTETTIFFNGGDTLAEATERFGEENVYNLYAAQLIVKVQAVIRRMVAEGKSQDEIQSELENWTPDTKRVSKKDPVAEAEKLLAKMSPEARAQLLAQFKGQA